MTTVRFFLVAAFAFGSLASTAAAQDTITFQGGDLFDPLNWLASDGVTTGFPTAMDTGIVEVDGEFAASGAANFMAEGDIIWGGGAVITLSIDFVAAGQNSHTFNDVTLNVDDDIFTGAAGGNYFFNAESVTNVDDDFEANAEGTITVNGGTHMVGLDSPNTGFFGSQNGSTLNFMGGTVTSEGFRTTQNGAGTLFGTINVGGDATLTTGSVSFTPLSVINFSCDWTGSLTDESGAGWEAAFAGTNATLEGVPIDAAVFAESFEVSADGTMLTLIPMEKEGGILGDANGDGMVDFFDIQPFIDLLTNQEFLFQADINGDGMVDFFDIQPFIDILSGGA